MVRNKIKGRNTLEQVQGRRTYQGPPSFYFPLNTFLLKRCETKKKMLMFLASMSVRLEATIVGNVMYRYC